MSEHFKKITIYPTVDAAITIAVKSGEMLKIYEHDNHREDECNQIRVDSTPKLQF